MTQLVGLVLVLALVAGGLLASGSPAVFATLPMELALIGGAALGTLLIANSAQTARQAMAGLGRALRGGRWRKRDHCDLLILLHELLRRIRRSGHVGIESDIERPEESALFNRAPQLMRDRQARDLLCDTVRLMGMDFLDARMTDQQMAQAIDATVGQRMRAVGALHAMADALPAFGIVAAVLGIIKTLGAIDQSTAVIGAMIASALMGTFLGVFLAYGLVSPLANRYAEVIEEEAVALDLIRTVLSAHADGRAPSAAVEAGRSLLPPSLQPSADEVEHALQAARFVAGDPARARAA